MTIGLATVGVISFETSAALVLGQNIGTTITAFLASLGTTVNAKRTAYFHIFFNIFGTFVVLLVFHPYLNFIRYISQFVFQGDPNFTPDGINFPNISKAIATTHTVFNVINTLLFLPFMGSICHILEKYVHMKAKPTKRYLTHLDFKHFETPLVAIEQSSIEVERMGKELKTMSEDLRTILTSQTFEGKAVDLFFVQEEHFDTVQKEVTDFVADVMGDVHNHEIADECRAQLRLADEYESISDYFTQILKLYIRLNKQDIFLNEAQKLELLELHNNCDEFLAEVIQFQPDSHLITRQQLQNHGKKITHYARKIREIHWQRLSDEKMQPLLMTAYSDIITSYRKVKGHLMNVVEAKAGEK
jgi:phosphate:Na+ symporter